MGKIITRNRTIDLMKFIFAFIIVFHHGRYLANPGDFKYFLGGYIAVDFFLLVSGYLMCLSSSKRPKSESLGKDTKSFMLHKFTGLLPNLYLAWRI